MAYATDDLKHAEPLVKKVISDCAVARALEICRWLLSFNGHEPHIIKCYQSFGKRPDIRFCIDRGGDCDGVKIMTGFLVIESNFELMGLFSRNADRFPYFKRNTDKRWRISATDTADLPMATICEHIIESYHERATQLNLESDVLRIKKSPGGQLQQEGAIMTDVFMNKDSWLVFVQDHNASANFNATQLNGSDSYTLAAIHLSAGVPIPKSVLLDTRRAQGKFVADHFSGLRKLYESGIESNRWLPDILDQSRKFARIHSVDCDEMIVKMIDMTEKKDRNAVKYKPIPLRAAKVEFADYAAAPKELVTETYDDDDIKI